MNQTHFMKNASTTTTKLPDIRLHYMNIFYFNFEKHLNVKVLTIIITLIGEDHFYIKCNILSRKGIQNDR